MQKQGRVTNSVHQLLGDAGDLRSRSKANAESASEALMHELHVHQIELEMQNETLRESQAALEESRDNYAEFYDFAPVGYLTLGDKGLIAEVNLTGAAMLGADRATLLQRSLSRCVAPEDRDRWHRHFVSALLVESSQNCEVALLRADGTRLYVRVDSLHRKGLGKSQKLRLVLTDISERKRIQDELADSLVFARSLIGSMCDGLSVVDINGVHLDVNPALCLMTGFAREELVGSGVPHPYWPPEGHERIQAAFRNVLKEEIGPLDLTFMRKSGERFFVNLSPSVVRDAKGAILGYMATVKDITEQKQAQEQLLEMAASLEMKVNERTNQLRQLSAQLALTEERERRLLALDLHDNLGQLLAIIKIKLTSLVVGSIDSSIDQVVELVDRAEQSTRAITLELSPPILHTLGLVPALEWLVEEVERIYCIRVHFDVERAPKPLVSEIQAMLYRSVRELLINIARHAKVSEAGLYCNCDGNRLTLVASDDGCGFDATGFHDGLPGHNTFGLNSIHERVANIGGTMEIDSSPGNGTTVTLTVPCAIAAKRNQR